MSTHRGPGLSLFSMTPAHPLHGEARSCGLASRLDKLRRDLHADLGDVLSAFDDAFVRFPDADDAAWKLVERARNVYDERLRHLVRLAGEEG